jgi:flavin-dependent dehydrogenase
LGRFDVVIVGASYSGMAAASCLPGRKLLVLERHDSVVSKHRGSLGFLLPIGDRVEVRGENLYSPRLDLFVEGGLRQRFSRLQLRGQRERIDFHLSRPLLLLNEQRLKGALLRRIREKGAEVRVGTAVREVDTDGREVKIRTEEEHRARVLVAADGVNSMVVRSLALRREKLAVLFQREVELDRLDVPADTLLMQIDDYRNYFFAYSLGDKFLASVIQIVGPREVPDDLQERLLDRTERLGAGRPLAARNAIVRLHEPLGVSFKDNVVLTGDALATYGFAGICGALTMGAMAGEAINRLLAGSHYALPDYHNNWRKATSQGFLEKLRWLSPVLSRLNARRIDRMVRATRGGSNGRAAPANLLWRLPAILLRFFV